MTEISDRAKRLLADALDGDGKRKGLIVMEGTTPGVTRIQTGDKEYEVSGGVAKDIWNGYFELLGRKLIVEYKHETARDYSIVSPLGCLAAGWQSG